MSICKKVKNEWNAVKGQESGDMAGEWQLFRSFVIGYAEEVCGMRHVGGGMRRGSERWCEEISLAVVYKLEKG